MAQMTIVIGDPWVSRILDAFDGMYPGRVLVDPETEEETELYTKVEWAKMRLRGYVVTIIRSWEAEQAADAAREASLEDTEAVDVTYE